MNLMTELKFDYLKIPKKRGQRGFGGILQEAIPMPSLIKAREDEYGKLDCFRKVFFFCTYFFGLVMALYNNSSCRQITGVSFL